MKHTKTRKIDSPLFLLVVTLCVIGVVMVYSASSFKAQESYGDSNFFLKRHFYKVLAGFIVMLVVAHIDYRFWLSISPGLLLLSVLILLYMLMGPDVERIRGSKRWLDAGLFRFQPSDFARLALILFLSLSLCASRLEKGKSISSFLFHLSVIAAIVLPVYLQPDLGSAVLTAGIALLIMFVAGERLQHLMLLGAGTMPFLVWAITAGGYRTERIRSFLSALNGDNVAWQVQQSLIAFGSGHFLGLGLGDGRQKYHFLPDPFTDFIFAIFGEELGLLGTTAILLLFLFLVVTGFRIALNSSDTQGKILGVGLVLNIAIYALTNMGVVLSLLPTTGVPMPFLSYGGSALFVNMFSVGVLLNIADRNIIAKKTRSASVVSGRAALRIVR